MLPVALQHVNSPCCSFWVAKWPQVDLSPTASTATCGDSLWIPNVRFPTSSALVLQSNIVSDTSGMIIAASGAQRLRPVFFLQSWWQFGLICRVCCKHIVQQNKPSSRIAYPKQWHILCALHYIDVIHYFNVSGLALHCQGSACKGLLAGESKIMHADLEGCARCHYTSHWMASRAHVISAGRTTIPRHGLASQIHWRLAYAHRANVPKAWWEPSHGMIILLWWQHPIMWNHASKYNPVEAGIWQDKERMYNSDKKQ